MSKFEQQLEQAKSVYFPQSEHVAKTNQIMDHLLEGKFADYARNFDQQAQGGGLRSFRDLGTDMKNMFRNKGDVQLDKSLKDQWKNMISAQQRMYKDPSKVMNFKDLEGVSMPGEVMYVTKLSGEDLFTALGKLRQTDHAWWDKLTRGMWPRNMYSTQQTITPDNPDWDNHMTNKWNKKTEAYRNNYPGGFDAWKAQEELNFQQQ